MLFKTLSLLFLLTLTCYVCAGATEEKSTLQDHCKEISNKLASVGYRECLSSKFEISEGHSVKGAPILVRKFISGTDEETHNRILLVGGIHGDEYSSVSVVFKWITLLEQYYTGTYQWQIIPLLNPDGLLQNSSKKLNANGVDLDRNFPANSGHDQAIKYWEENLHWDTEYFPGKQALSEPESQWLVEEINRYKPDAIITVHAPNNSLAFKISSDKPAKLGAQYQKSITALPGSFIQYVGTLMNIPILTVELPYADVMPAKSEINEIWRNLIKWLNEHLKLSR
jgi:murein peptide amidase A